MRVVGNEEVLGFKLTSSCADRLYMIEPGQPARYLLEHARTRAVSQLNISGVS
jgi:hypothetical protein